MWKALDAYAGVIWLLRRDGRDFDPAFVSTLHGQAAADAAFDRALGHVHDMLAAASAADFDWPADVPAPGQTITDRNQAAARDFAYIAGAYVLLHELGHRRLADCRIEYALREERLCDAYARGILLDGTETYAASQGYPEEMVRAKRLLGILLAKLLIITLTPRDRWTVSPDHEPVRRRLFRVLRYAKEPLPIWFWDTAAAMLAAFARHHGVLNVAIPFRSSRELAFAICRAFS
ncbi:phage exclusion protein Lit family protein [Bradyrhizobium guangdongense]|uniref:phage exclusion protein Lit family protein n=1 Tax=Bradyrhizobium guangdongense TaxID=1325090 RepID=UPI001FD5EA91|nr:phage exclusion protein Lit family protein [Bradyrhizobium guangdongense]